MILNLNVMKRNINNHLDYGISKGSAISEKTMSRIFKISMTWEMLIDYWNTAHPEIAY